MGNRYPPLWVTMIPALARLICGLTKYMYLLPMGTHKVSITDFVHEYLLAQCILPSLEVELVARWLLGLDGGGGALVVGVGWR